MNKPVIILGNGGHAAVLTEILLEQKRNIIGFTAPHQETNRFGLSYIGTDEAIKSYCPSEVELVLGIGSTTVPTFRAQLFCEIKAKGYLFTNVIHRTAIVSDYAQLGEGIQILAGAMIQPFSKIADNTIINTGAIIEHDCQIGRHCHIAPGVVFSGGVHVEEQVHIGTGATVIQNVMIGANTMIGAGSVVIKNVKSGQVVYGVPAKEVNR